jgi:hypothetical protein
MKPAICLVLALLAACGHPSNAPRVAPSAHPSAKPSGPVRVVVRDAKSVQDFWSATLTRPRRIAVVRGAVRASAVFPSPLRNEARLRVTDGGRTVFDAVVGDVPMGFQFTDLAGTGSVLLFDGFTGGAHCCFDTTIVQLGRGEGQATRVDWGDPGYDLLESGSGNGFVFRTGDKRMAYAFSSFAASTFSIEVVALRNGVVRDITDEYPALIARDANRQWATYLRRKHDPDLFIRTDVEPPLVSYLADEYRLGRATQAWARVRAANGPAHAFYANALEWLRTHDYVT